MINDYRDLLIKSETFKYYIDTFGLSSEDLSRSFDGHVSILENLKDWRIDNILNLDRQFGLKVCEGGVVLDAGCGIGSLTIAEKLRGINIIGIENHPASVRLSRQLASVAGFSEKESYSIFRQGSVEDIPYPENYFSMITCHQVIEHVDNIVDTIKEFIRVLKPGGMLHIDAPDYRFPYEPHYRIPYMPFMKKELAKIWLKEFDKPLSGLSDFHYVSLPHCLGILISVGFELIQAITTTPEAQIKEQIQAVLMNNRNNISINYLTSDPGKICLLAKEVKKSSVQPKETSFMILCRKPDKEIYPGRFNLRAG